MSCYSVPFFVFRKKLKTKFTPRRAIKKTFRYLHGLYFLLITGVFEFGFCTLDRFSAISSWVSAELYYLPSAPLRLPLPPGASSRVLPTGFFFWGAKKFQLPKNGPAGGSVSESRHKPIFEPKFFGAPQKRSLWVPAFKLNIFCSGAGDNAKPGFRVESRTCAT